MREEMNWKVIYIEFFVSFGTPCLWEGHGLFMFWKWLEGAWRGGPFPICHFHRHSLSPHLTLSSGRELGNLFPEISSEGAYAVPPVLVGTVKHFCIFCQVSDVNFIT